VSFPRYPSYKDSKSDWAAQVPEHWQLMPCRGFVDERTEKNEDALCQNYLSLMANVGVIPYEEKGDIGNKKPEDLSKCKLVRRGDFVINSMNYGIGFYGASAYDGVCSPVYIVMKPRQDIVESGFAFRVFEDKSFQAQAQSLGNGILAHRCAISWDDLKGISVGIPPVAEQRAILEFLDRETAKIDALIAEQQRLIELLQEKRQAVISHAVTKGLNPNTPMKDSGAEWLGEVPEHWEVRKLSQLCAGIGSGTTPKSDRLEFYEDGTIPWVVTGDLNDSMLEECSNRITDRAINEHSTLKLYEAGSVVVAMYGATIGKAALLGIQATVNQACCVLPPSRKVRSEYLLLFVLAARSHLLSLATGGGQPNINQEVIRSLRIPVPAVSEQEDIARQVRSSLGGIDSVSSMASKQVELLQERRSALISAAVTGQIDVRGLVSEVAEQ
jgi:type I restriction enzyme, S subunit